MSQPSTDDLKGIPHIVIVKTDTDLRVIEFTGEDAMEKAHESAQEIAGRREFNGCVTVACRVRQLYSYASKHLAT